MAWGGQHNIGTTQNEVGGTHQAIIDAIFIRARGAGIWSNSIYAATSDFKDDALR